MPTFIIHETAVGNINGAAISLSGIYSSPATEGQDSTELVDVYVRGVLNPAKKSGDILDINGEQWEIASIQSVGSNPELKRGQVSFSKRE